MKAYIRKLSSFWRVCIFVTVGPLITIQGTNLLLGNKWMYTLPPFSVVLVIILSSYAILYLSYSLGTFVIFLLETQDWLIKSDVSKKVPQGTRARDIFSLTWQSHLAELREVWEEADENKEGEDKTIAFFTTIACLIVYGVIGLIAFLLCTVGYLVLSGT